MNRIKSTVPGYPVICRAWWCAFGRMWRNVSVAHTTDMIHAIEVVCYRLESK